MALETTDNGAGSSSSGGISSGTASESMIKAATALSSEGSQPAGERSAGDTSASGAPGTGVATAPATTGVQPTGQPDATGARGPIPYDRHEAAMRNLRNQYGWAEAITSQYGLQAQDVVQGVNLLMRLRSDPAAFARTLAGELGLGETREAEPDFTMPDPDLVSQDGRHQAYSAASVKRMLEITRQQIIREIRGEIQPLSEFQTGLRTERQSAEIVARAQQEGQTALNRMRMYPRFKENEKAIGAKMAEMGQADPALIQNPIALMMLAYNAVLEEKVFPGYGMSAEQRVREENARKAAASAGSVHPSGGGGAPQKPVLRNADDLARHMERLAGSSAA